MIKQWMVWACATAVLSGASACSSDKNEVAEEPVAKAEAVAKVESVTGSPTTAVPSVKMAVSEMRKLTQPRLNINTATAKDLGTIPDVGKRMLREFDEYRPYLSIRQFRKEIGKYVDDAQVAAFENYIYVPIDINEADAETLAQIAGMTPDIAKKLEEGRPYKTSASFLIELAKHVTDPEARAAAALLKKR